jgi:hypothetical protein
MRPELSALVPLHKSDLQNARAAVALGWPAVEPIVPQLLRWLQDINWPVAHVLAPFFAEVGPALAPQVRAILETDDDVWKYYVIQAVVAYSPGLARALEGELQRIALRPTASEHKEQVDVVAKETWSNCEEGA